MMEQEHQQHPLDICVLETAASLVTEQMLPVVDDPISPTVNVLVPIEEHEAADGSLLVTLDGNSNNNNKNANSNNNKDPKEDVSLSAAEARKRRKSIITSQRRSVEIMEQATKDLVSAVLDDLVSLDHAAPAAAAAASLAGAVTVHKRKHEDIILAAESALQELEGLKGGGGVGESAGNNNIRAPNPLVLDVDAAPAPPDDKSAISTIGPEEDSLITTPMHHGDGITATPAVASPIALALTSPDVDVSPATSGDPSLDPSAAAATLLLNAATNTAAADDSMAATTDAADGSAQTAAAMPSSASSTSLSNSKKTQIRYEPAVPMDKDQLTAWRREARRVRNRESAAASRMKTKERIQELEEQVGGWKQKYLAAMERLQALQQHAGEGGGPAQPASQPPLPPPAPDAQRHHDDDEDTENDVNFASALGSGGA